MLELRPWDCNAFVHKVLGQRGLLKCRPGLFSQKDRAGGIMRMDCAYTAIRHLSLKHLLPETEQYMTYEGSTTHPGCWETTVWIILNKPIYITKHELYALRKLVQGSEEIPRAPLGNNARPLQPLYHRTVRTNIDFHNSDLSTMGKNCPVSMHKEMYYKANTWREADPLYQV